MKNCRLWLVVLLSLVAHTALWALGPAPAVPSQDQPVTEADLGTFTWLKNQFEMAVPPDANIVQETDSMIVLRGECFELYIVMEDRSMVSEESCIQYIFDDVRRRNGSFSEAPYYMLKERSTGCYYLATYPHEELGECLMAESCLIDRTSRRIFTVAFFATHACDAVVQTIIASPAVSTEIVQY